MNTPPKENRRMKKNAVITACLSTLAPALLLAGGAALTRDYLTKHTFIPVPGYEGSKVLFQNNGTYSYVSRGNGGEYLWKGAYAITGNSVTLTPSECRADGRPMDCRKSHEGVRTCSLQLTPGDLYYDHYLVCVENKSGNTEKLHTDDAAVRAGSEKRFKGAAVVTMGMARGVTTAGVKMREKPSTNARALEYCDSPYGGATCRPSVPEKTEVTVIARTREKEKAQNWTNYWYLVNVDEFNNEVWLFGEFVRIK